MRNPAGELHGERTHQTSISKDIQVRVNMSECSGIGSTKEIYGRNLWKRNLVM